jgi:hypothetical protein
MFRPRASRRGRNASWSDNARGYAGLPANRSCPGDRIAPQEAGGLLVSAMNVAPEAEAEFNQWYDTEHLPNLAALPGVLCARRFRSVGGGMHKYVAVYHLVSPDTCETDDWRRASQTPGRTKSVNISAIVLRLRTQTLRETKLNESIPRPCPRNEEKTMTSAKRVKLVNPCGSARRGSRESRRPACFARRQIYRVHR